MSENFPDSDHHAENSRRRRKLRWFALGAFVFLLLEVALLTFLPHGAHEAQRGRLLTFVVADAFLAAVVCVILVVSLRKE